ncbi:glycosyltransferase [bacterium]|nr:glycosyltransferase [bacterium]
MAHDHPPIDVVIPVFNGHDAVERCLSSVIRGTHGDHVRIVVADDASTDVRISKLLESFAAMDERIQVIRRPENLGFVRNCNLAMQESGADIVLLNSDTEVPNGWLERLHRLAWSGDRIGSVTPLSNNATICSVPTWLESNQIPDGLGVDALDVIAQETGTGEWIEIPTSIGFCVYYRRSALGEAGYFDEKLFDKGYGEENDLALRMRDSGLLNLLCDTVYVYHEGGVSFAEEGARRLSENLDALGSVWPTYHQLIHDYIVRNPLWGVQARFGLGQLHAARSDRLRVLYVLHSRLWSGVIGGTEFHVMDLVERIEGHTDPLILSFDEHGNGLLQWRVGGVIGSFPLPGDSLSINPVAWVRRLLGVGVDVVHIQHAMRSPLEFVEALLDRAEDVGVPVIWTFHDYFTLCPSAHLLDARSGDACVSLGSDGTCTGCENLALVSAGMSVVEWRRRWGGLTERCARVLAPSPAAAAIIESAQPTLRGRIDIEPHGVAGVTGTAEELPEGDPEAGIVEPRHIAILGYGGAHKGDGVLNNVVDLVTDLNVTWHLLGRKAYGGDHDNVIVHGNYDRDSLPEILRSSNIGLVVLLSPWPETYSYTLSEAWQCGLPVIGSRLGAIGERIEIWGGGVTVDPFDAEDIAGAVRSAVADTESYERLSAEARRAGLSLRTLTDMATAYEELYDSVAGGRHAALMAPPILEPDLREMEGWLGAFVSPVEIGSRRGRLAWS